MLFRQVWALAPLVLAVGVGCSESPPSSRPRAVEVPTPASAQSRTAPDRTPARTPEKPPEKAAERPPEKSTEKPAPANPSVSATTNAGVISGLVRWEGPLPDNSTSQGEPRPAVTVAGRQVEVRPVPRLRVDPRSSGVADVVVYLAEPPTEPLLEPPEPARLVQKNGNYLPHVQVVQRGLDLQLGTSDDRADFHASGAASFSATLDAGQTRSLPLRRAGLVEVRSELHPWMTPAHVHVLEHAYYVVTGPGGRFNLPRVPPGDYRVVLWHEGWRPPDPDTRPVRAEVSVTVTAKEGAAIHWTLPAP